MQFNPLTFVFEIVNFMVLLFVLQRLVFRPLKRGIDARRAEEHRIVEDAAEAKEEAVRVQREVDEERRALVEVRARALREAAEEAAEERARILSRAHEDAAAERTRAMKLLETEREAAEAWVREVTVERATEAAGRMLLALAPQAVEDALRARLFEELTRRGAAFAPHGEGPIDVELRCAKLPDDATIESTRTVLGAALGRPARLTVKEDESLLAGTVVRVGDRLLDASIAGQLEGLRERTRAILEEEEHG